MEILPQAYLSNGGMEGRRHPRLIERLMGEENYHDAAFETKSTRCPCPESSAFAIAPGLMGDRQVVTQLQWSTLEAVDTRAIGRTE